MFLSIIVPIFNVEAYLKKCVESILACGLNDYELIFVNDGSQDSSYNICLEFKKNYDFIKVIDQENGGLSNARNAGLSIAVGEYVIFIDSDDYIISESFYKTIIKLENIKKFDIDIIISDFFRVSQNNIIVSRINQIEESKEIITDIKYMESFLSSNGCFWNTWRFIFNRRFLLENNFQFKDGFLCEDIDFAVKTLLNTKNIAFYHNPYYCYKIGRENSIMNVVSIKRVKDYLLITQECVELLNKNKGIFFSNKMKDKLCFEYILNLATIYEVSKENREEAKVLFMKTLYVLKMTENKKYKRLNCIINVFGISSVAFMLFLLKKTRRMVKYGREFFKKNEKL